MNALRPRLFATMKSYTKEQFIKDIIAGIIVAIIALPLSIALALASGVKPEQGLYTAIAAGFVISFLGGSRVQIAGPTAAFATIVAGVVAKNGMDGLLLATVLAGLLLILMGILRLGSFIKFIPYTITTGFTFGIAITIVIGQVKDFLGLSWRNSPIETIDKLRENIENFHTFNGEALLIGMISLAILLLWPKISTKIPGSLVVVIVTALLVKLVSLKVNTIGDLYEISSKIPTVSLPVFSLSKIRDVLPDAITIAMLAAIESLLSCVVSDGMIGSKHNSNMELIAQGTGNIFSALFGGIPATGAIARTAANVKNGGRTPISGMVHAVVLFFILILMMPYAKLIPMPAIAAILFYVAYHMSEWKEFVKLLKTAPKSDCIVLLTTFILTVAFDLVFAIAIGLVLASLLFMKRMADVTEVSGWKYINHKEASESDINFQKLKSVPKNTLVYEINGPLFFGAADEIMKIVTDTSKRVVIIRMSSVPAIDATALRSLHKVLHTCRTKNVKVIFSHVKEQPMAVMTKAGLVNEIGEENFCSCINEALQRANLISA